MKFNLYVCVVLLALVYSGHAEDHLKKLRHDLFVKNNYDKLVRPAKDWKQTTNVEVGLTLTRIGSVNAVDQTLNVDAFMWLSWTDDYLQWTPSDYDGIKVMRIESDDIWKPDVVPYNGVDIAAINDKTMKTRALIFASGQVMWIPPMSIQSMCDVDVRLYPRDTQRCNITLGSWTNHAGSMNITVKSGGLTDSEMPITHGNWRLVGNNTIRKERVYDCCKDEVYPTITYELFLKRHNPMSCLTIKLPQGISFLLTLLSFWIPARCLKGRLVVTAVAMLFAYTTIYYIANEVGGSATHTPYAVLCSGMLACLALLAMALAVLSNRITRKPFNLPSSCQYSGGCPITKWLCRHADNAKPSVCQEKTALDCGNEPKRDDRAEQAAYCLDRIFFASYVALAVVTHIILALR